MNSFGKALNVTDNHLYVKVLNCRFKVNNLTLLLCWNEWNCRLWTNISVYYTICVRAERGRTKNHYLHIDGRKKHRNCATTVTNNTVFLKSFLDQLIPRLLFSVTLGNRLQALHINLRFVDRIWLLSPLSIPPSICLLSVPSIHSVSLFVGQSVSYLVLFDASPHPRPLLFWMI